MTQDEIKKGLENAAKVTGNRVFAGAYKIIIEQEKSIQMAQDQILFVAQQNQEYREQQVKQAKIDMLNRVMTYINDKIENDYGDMSDSVKYLTINIDDFDDFIDELIEEVENEQKD
jgi:hypothetical protein